MNGLTGDGAAIGLSIVALASLAWDIYTHEAQRKNDEKESASERAGA